MTSDIWHLADLLVKIRAKHYRTRHSLQALRFLSTASLQSKREDERGRQGSERSALCVTG